MAKRQKKPSVVPNTSQFSDLDDSSAASLHSFLPAHDGNLSDVQGEEKSLFTTTTSQSSDFGDSPVPPLRSILPSHDVNLADLDFEEKTLFHHSSADDSSLSAPSREPSLLEQLRTGLSKGWDAKTILNSKRLKNDTSTKIILSNSSDGSIVATIPQEFRPRLMRKKRKDVTINFSLNDTALSRDDQENESPPLPNPRFKKPKPKNISIPIDGLLTSESSINSSQDDSLVDRKNQPNPLMSLHKKGNRNMTMNFVLDESECSDKSALAEPSFSNVNEVSTVHETHVNPLTKKCRERKISIQCQFDDSVDRELSSNKVACESAVKKVSADEGDAVSTSDFTNVVESMTSQDMVLRLDSSDEAPMDMKDQRPVSNEMTCEDSTKKVSVEVYVVESIIPEVFPDEVPTDVANQPAVSSTCFEECLENSNAISVDTEPARDQTFVIESATATVEGKAPEHGAQENQTPTDQDVTTHKEKHNCGQDSTAPGEQDCSADETYQLLSAQVNPLRKRRQKLDKISIPYNFEDTIDESSSKEEADQENLKNVASHHRAPLLRRSKRGDVSLNESIPLPSYVNPLTKRRQERNKISIPCKLDATVNSESACKGMASEISYHEDAEEKLTSIVDNAVSDSFIESVARETDQRSVNSEETSLEHNQALEGTDVIRTSTEAVRDKSIEVGTAVPIHVLPGGPDISHSGNAAADGTFEERVTLSEPGDTVPDAVNESVAEKVPMGAGGSGKDYSEQGPMASGEQDCSADETFQLPSAQVNPLRKRRQKLDKISIPYKFDDTIDKSSSKEEADQENLKNVASRNQAPLLRKSKRRDGSLNETIPLSSYVNPLTKRRQERNKISIPCQLEDTVNSESACKGMASEFSCHEDAKDKSTSTVVTAVSDSFIESVARETVQRSVNSGETSLEHNQALEGTDVIRTSTEAVRDKSIEVETSAPTNELPGGQDSSHSENAAADVPFEERVNLSEPGDTVPGAVNESDAEKVPMGTGGSGKDYSEQGPMAPGERDCSADETFQLPSAQVNPLRKRRQKLDKISIPYKFDDTIDKSSSKEEAVQENLKNVAPPLLRRSKRGDGSLNETIPLPSYVNPLTKRRQERNKISIPCKLDDTVNSESACKGVASEISCHEDAEDKSTSTVVTAVSDSFIESVARETVPRSVNSGETSLEHNQALEGTDVIRTSTEAVRAKSIEVETAAPTHEFPGGQDSSHSGIAAADVTFEERITLSELEHTVPGTVNASPAEKVPMEAGGSEKDCSGQGPMAPGEQNRSVNETFQLLSGQVNPLRKIRQKLDKISIPSKFDDTIDEYSSKEEAVQKSLKNVVSTNQAPFLRRSKRTGVSFDGTVPLPNELPGPQESSHHEKAAKETVTPSEQEDIVPGDKVTTPVEGSFAKTHDLFAETAAPETKELIGGPGFLGQEIVSPGAQNNVPVLENGNELSDNGQISNVGKESADGIFLLPSAVCPQAKGLQMMKNVPTQENSTQYVTPHKILKNESQTRKSKRKSVSFKPPHENLYHSPPEHSSLQNGSGAQVQEFSRIMMTTDISDIQPCPNAKRAKNHMSSTPIPKKKFHSDDKVERQPSSPSTNQFLVPSQAAKRVITKAQIISAADVQGSSNSLDLSCENSLDISAIPKDVTAPKWGNVFHSTPLHRTRASVKRSEKPAQPDLPKVPDDQEPRFANHSVQTTHNLRSKSTISDGSSSESSPSGSLAGSVRRSARKKDQSEDKSNGENNSPANRISIHDNTILTTRVESQPKTRASTRSAASSAFESFDSHRRITSRRLFDNYDEDKSAVLVSVESPKSETSSKSPYHPTSFDVPSTSQDIVLPLAQTDASVNVAQPESSSDNESVVSTGSFNSESDGNSTHYSFPSLSSPSSKNVDRKRSKRTEPLKPRSKYAIQRPSSNLNLFYPTGAPPEKRKRKQSNTVQLFNPGPKWKKSKKLYAWLKLKLQPVCGLRTNLEAERLVIELDRARILVSQGHLRNALSQSVDQLKRLGLCSNQLELWGFCMEFMPFDFIRKMVPMGGAFGQPFDPNDSTLPYDPI